MELAKGTRDYLPREKITRDLTTKKLREIFERYGYSPLETPALERMETLESKFAGGSELLKEVFTLKDRGERNLGLRYDLTVPLARVISMNPQLRLPFKRYQIDKAWRDGPMSAGRIREFWQCDVDVIGSASMFADAELLALAQDVFASLEIPICMKVNDRKIQIGIMETLGIPPDVTAEAISALDKLDKIGIEGVKAELTLLCVKEDTVKELLSIVTLKGSAAEILDQLGARMTAPIGLEGLREMSEMLGFLALLGVENLELDLSLTRGQSYYTGPIFEVFDKLGRVRSSLAGGGRFDKMIGRFLGQDKDIPATGISFGLEPISVLLTDKSDKNVITDVWVIPLGTFDECIGIVQCLRKQGNKADIDTLGRSLRKTLEYANAQNIPYCVIIGRQELGSGLLTLRDMKTGDEQKVTAQDIPKALANHGA